MRINLKRGLGKGALTALILATAIGSASTADYRPLVGRWQRTDGGYEIEIQKVAPDGAMVTVYLNPRPINVSRARASMFKDRLKVEVELHDTGYPGSTYTLIYDPKKDTLMGLYYQAVQRQNFEVIFVRMMNP